MAADIGSIMDDITNLATQVGQNQQVILDLKSGVKKLAIVPGDQPSLVISTGGTVNVGIPLIPILAVLGAAMFLLSRKR